MSAARPEPLRRDTRSGSAKIIPHLAPEATFYFSRYYGDRQAERLPYNPSATPPQPCRASAPLAGLKTKEKLLQPVAQNPESND